MRYLIHESQLKEMSARKDYLFDVFHLYFLPGTPEGNYTPFSPVGEKGPDILFITGHTDSVFTHLDKMIMEIPEKTIVITSCYGERFKKFSNKKNGYVPKSRDELCCIRSGKPYGFDFNISDAELDFYNAHGDIYTRIKSAYTLL